MRRIVNGMLYNYIFLLWNLMLFVFWLFLLHFVRIWCVFMIVCKFSDLFNGFVLVLD